MGDLTFNQPPSLTWRWRDREGNLHDPASMETRHLFHTLRMLWNNALPAHIRVGTVHLYRFGRAYTARYLREAISRIGSEVLRRPDLTHDQRAQLDEMARWFLPEQDALGETKRLGHGR